MKSRFRPLTARDLSDEEKDAALESLMLFKEKLEGSIKGRACTDGRKQRSGSPKEDATSPTMSLKAVLTTSVINAYELRSLTYPGHY